MDSVLLSVYLNQMQFSRAQLKRLTIKLKMKDDKVKSEGNKRREGRTERSNEKKVIVLRRYYVKIEKHVQPTMFIIK